MIELRNLMMYCSNTGYGCWDSESRGGTHHYGDQEQLVFLRGWIRLIMSQGQHSRVNGRHTCQPTVSLEVPIGGKVTERRRPKRRSVRSPDMTLFAISVVTFCVIEKAESARFARELCT